MTIRLHELAVTGPNKEPALLVFHGKSHLIFGPTDTGKSYVVECLRFALGGSQRPKDVGYSEGYNRVALQITSGDETEFTLFRDLTEGNESVYQGFHSDFPPTDATPLPQEISRLLLSCANGEGKKILTKSGTRGNFTAGDLRHVSIFDEIETLNNVPLEGKDTNLKVRNKSALALILTGVDDSDILLPPSTNARNIAKGHVEALTEELSNLRADISEEIPKSEAEAALVRVSAEIDRIYSYLQIHSEELNTLKKERALIDREVHMLSQRFSALVEARSRFLLLDKKYENDLQRLQAICTAASIVTNFDARPCPLCLTDIQHQSRHSSEDENFLVLKQAAEVEGNKILGLRRGLQQALTDVIEELLQIGNQLDVGRETTQRNLERQEVLLSPEARDLKSGLETLVDRKSKLSFFLRDLERAERLELKINEVRASTKPKKQKIDRDISHSATNLCARIKDLLQEWGVPNVRSVHFNESVADIDINQRKRISYGKGKRGIFLTAYVLALMEQAIAKDHPHLGIIVVDSPVVTYRDPKHGKDDKEELLPVGVKDKFYSWLSDRNGDGQIIVLENEEPDEEIKSKMNITEFFGPNADNMRIGFFPISEDAGVT